MPGFYLTTEDGKPVTHSNRLPVDIGGGGGGGSIQVDITGNTAGIASEAKQDEIIQAIQGLAGGGSSSEIFDETIEVTTSPTQLPDQAISKVLLLNDKMSSKNIIVGGTNTPHFPLSPGESVVMEITNLNLLYVKTDEDTATLHYIALGPAGIPGGGNAPVPVQLTGRKVEQITLFNSLAISDQNRHSSQQVDISKYSQVILQVINTLNQPVVIDADSADFGLGYRIIDPTQQNTPISITVPSGVTRIRQITANEFKVLIPAYKKFSLGVQCTAGAPTSGSFSAILTGVVI